VITVREKGAKKILEDIGIRKEIIVTADPALLLIPEPLPAETLKKEHIDDKKCLVGMSVREPGVAAPDIDEEFYHGLLANAADYMVDRFNADILFIPMEQRKLDVQHSHAVIAKMLRPQRAWVLKEEYTSGQILSIMKHLNFAVGMRLHFLIFAALQEVPFVALPYSAKVGGFLDDMKVQIPPIQLVNSGRLIAYIDKFWDEQKTVKSNIHNILPSLKERALETNKLAVELLTKKNENQLNQALAL
jgi:polysaccharide pyruvyl transferase WcaK-like protein